MRRFVETVWGWVLRFIVGGFVAMLFVGVGWQAVSQGLPKFLLVLSLVAWVGIMTGTSSRRRG